jgi:surface antigen
MAGRFYAGALLALMAVAVPAGARVAIDAGNRSGPGERTPPDLECVPFARQLTGVRIYGDAHTWWDQAEGRYARGSAPKVGAVMAFRPHGNSRLGHVAAVTRIVDSRTVLISHANWSPIDGRRGQIERDVEAVDVSPNNDWSLVRVWFAPIQALGATAWPLAGFIYDRKPSGTRTSPALAKVARTTEEKTRLATSLVANRRAGKAEAPPPRQTGASDPIGDIIAWQGRPPA